MFCATKIVKLSLTKKLTKKGIDTTTKLNQNKKLRKFITENNFYDTRVNRINYW